MTPTPGVLSRSALQQAGVWLQTAGSQAASAVSTPHCFRQLEGQREGVSQMLPVYASGTRRASQSHLPLPGHLGATGSCQQRGRRRLEGAGGAGRRFSVSGPRAIEVRPVVVDGARGSGLEDTSGGHSQGGSAWWRRD